MKLGRDESFDEYSGSDKEDKSGSLKRKPAAALIHKTQSKKRDKSVTLKGVRNILRNKQ